ncbi:hypothetical protein BB561_005289 [Smittium simulii]|uniref:Uncharacterized protein n=1 Tax=Smittium simulii TaxID=133385 RepID=A0A2T9YB54_9FUNG|nr:hypothetical protein BB561_005289 [Smittium simulii]
MVILSKFIPHVVRIIIKIVANLLRIDEIVGLKYVDNKIRSSVDQHEDQKLEDDKNKLTDQIQQNLGKKN